MSESPNGHRAGSIATALVALVSVHAAARGQCEPIERGRLEPDEGVERLGLSAAIAGNLVLVGANEAAYFYTVPGGPAAVLTLTPSDGMPGDSFGLSVDVHDGRAVVGAPLNDEIADNAGAAYVYSADAGWGEAAKLVPWQGEEDGWCGRAVAISFGVAAVGAPREEQGTGAMYVFRRDEGGPENWGGVVRHTASDGEANDELGSSVDIDGIRMIAGAPGHGRGAAYVFEGFGEVAKLTPPDEDEAGAFGAAVALDGDLAVVGALYTPPVGAAYIHARNAGGADQWGRVATLVPEDPGGNPRFGWSVAIEGDTAIVGGPTDSEGGEDAGAVWVFARNAGGPDAWGQVAKIIPGEGPDRRAGQAVAVSRDFAVAGAWTTPGGGAGHVLAINDFLMNDNGVPTVVCPCFAAGEQAAAWLTAERGGWLRSVEILWASVLGGQPERMEREVHVYRAGAFPDPGEEITEGDFVDPILFDGGIMTFPFEREVYVAAGETIVVSLEFRNANVEEPLAPSVLHDNSGKETGLSTVYVLPDAEWVDAALLGVNGQWALRATVDVTACCPGDIDGNRLVDFADLLSVLAAWGEEGGPQDVDGSGIVDFGDVLAVLAGWGPCR